MTALPLPAGAGGFDGTAVDMLLVMQELGAAWWSSPTWPPCWAHAF